MVNDIRLTSAMNNNLLALQNTSKLMDMTQERLSTGLKVNSAIDNPSAYFTAQGLNQRAGDLSGLLDSIGQAVQTLKAADEGIESITTFVQQAKAVAQQARDSQDGEAREASQKQFNAILKEIDALAGDSGYRGTNLLKAQDLTVVFNEKFDTAKNSYTIKGVDATTGVNGLNIEAADGWKADLSGLTAPDDPEDANYATDLAAYNQGVADAEADALEAIDDAIAAVEEAISKLRTYASDFGNSYSIVQTREAFTENLISVLTEGADKLTLADMNEESANMLALQTRQQLGINALSLASQANQAVLKLF